MADPSARVWKDGKLYLYGSRDENCAYYCSKELVALSTENLKDWVLHKGLLRSDENQEAIQGTDSLLFAPDCMYRDGQYFLYFCTPDKNYPEGVAVSHSPIGPFTETKQLNVLGFNEIDPAVFIDDDGQAYYLWGQFSLKMAKLNSDMKSLEQGSLIKDVLTEKEHHFHEGAFLFKRKELYYLVYSDISRADMPTCLGYATSQSPTGPYDYRGVIIDNRMCNPGNWNNHGSIVHFNDEWYVIYHRSTHGSNTMRKACLEPIHFEEDGSIPEVEMTTQGAGLPLNAYQAISAARACLLMGDAMIKADGHDREILTTLRSGAKAAFKYIDFKEGVTGGTIRVKTLREGAEIWLMADQVWHPTFAHIKIPPTSHASDEWQTIHFKTHKIIEGTHTLWLYIRNAPSDGLNMDWIQFDSSHLIDK